MKGRPSDPTIQRAAMLFKTLDDLSRQRALTDDESRELEVAQKRLLHGGYGARKERIRLGITVR